MTSSSSRAGSVMNSRASLVARICAACWSIACTLLFSGAALAGDNRLFIYNWADFIGKSTLQDFQRATGIKVVYDTYDAEETKETKLMAGGSGYDIVVSSSEYFSREIKAGVYQPLDKRRLPGWSNLNPHAL